MGVRIGKCILTLFVYFLSFSSDTNIKKTAQISQFERFVYVLSLYVLCDQWSWRDSNSRPNEEEFSEFEGFDFQIQESHYVANFSIDGLPIEIYAENKPTQYQNAYLHMMIEYRLIQLLGADFKASIVTLKQQGYKTEPAFGKLLGLKNPYMDLLELERKTNDELFEMEVSRKQKP